MSTHLLIFGPAHRSLEAIPLGLLICHTGHLFALSPRSLGGSASLHFRRCKFRCGYELGLPPSRFSLGLQLELAELVPLEFGTLCFFALVSGLGGRKLDRSSSMLDVVVHHLLIAGCLICPQFFRQRFAFRFKYHRLELILFQPLLALAFFQESELFKHRGLLLHRFLDPTLLLFQACLLSNFLPGARTVVAPVRACG
jgi:hypothetical protein